MSNGVASAGTSSGSSTNTNSASGSRKRRISHAHAARSTWQCRRVAHLTHRPSSTSAASSSTARARARARAAGSSRARGSGAARGEAARASATRPGGRVARRRGVRRSAPGTRPRPTRAIATCSSRSCAAEASSPTQIVASPPASTTSSASHSSCSRLRAVERQRDEPVEDLRGAEPPQLPPERDPRRRRLARQPVGEQHPLCRRHSWIITHATSVARLVHSPDSDGYSQRMRPPRRNHA